MAAKLDMIIRTLNNGTEIIVDMFPCPYDTNKNNVGDFKIYYRRMFPDDFIEIRCISK